MNLALTAADILAALDCVIFWVHGSFYPEALWKKTGNQLILGIYCPMSRLINSSSRDVN